MVAQLFFLAHILKTTSYFSQLFHFPQIYVSAHFLEYSRKKSECSFFQNISPKSTTTFFSKIFSRISQISRKLHKNFFKIFRQNQQPPFFRKFFQGFLKFLENYTKIFSKYFAKINNHLFFENFFKDFSNFSKTTQKFF